MLTGMYPVCVKKKSRKLMFDTMVYYKCPCVFFQYIRKKYEYKCNESALLLKGAKLIVCNCENKHSDIKINQHKL